jgi:RNA polymerase sigma-70 factor, ECF subfamily
VRPVLPIGVATALVEALPARRRLGVNPERDSDAELIRRVGWRDPAAFEELYRRFARPVLGLALRVLGDPGRAEDATQEAFAAVWRSARTFRPERGTGSAWLYAVARHAIIDDARARREPAVEAPDEAAADDGPEEAAEKSWLAWEVHAALDRLPERERVVLELAYWSGLSQSEIASYLDVPLGTVKTRVRTGLARLGGILEAGR